MSTHEEERAFNSVAFACTAENMRDKLADYYDLPRMREEDATVIIGDPPLHTLERVNERTYSIVETGEGGYSLNAEDFQNFEREVDVAFSDRPDTEEIGRALFVGLGVAGTALAHILRNNMPPALRQRSYAHALKEFFASHDGIEESFRSMFTGKMQGRAEMVSDMYDARAMSINGLRVRLRILFDAMSDTDDMPIFYDDLITHAREHIPELYTAESQHYCDVMVMSLAQSPQKGDSMFFATLPDWLIAAAAPIRPQELRQIVSPAWQHE
jgi:hypothetical protein